MINAKFVPWGCCQLERISYLGTKEKKRFFQNDQLFESDQMSATLENVLRKRDLFIYLKWYNIFCSGPHLLKTGINQELQGRHNLELPR